MIKLSIILPCYGVEKYITECLDSIYNQDIPESEYEVICVNDCSPDNTKAIIEEYKKHHPGLKLINHQINKKQGGARNTGMQIAQGEYIWFIDPDDFIQPNCLGEIIDFTFKNNLEILNFTFTLVNQFGENPKLYHIAENVFTTGVDFLQNKINWWINGASTIRLYQKDFLIKNNLTFRENGYFEDLVFSLKSVYYANRFMYLENGYYYYRSNPVSAMNSKPDENKRLSVLANITDFISFYYEIKDENSLFAESVLDAAIYRFDNVFGKCIFFNNRNRRTAYQLITENITLIKTKSQLKSWKRIMLNHLDLTNFLLILFSPVFRSVRNLSYKIKK